MRIGELAHGEAYVTGPDVRQTGAFTLLVRTLNALIGRTGGILGEYVPLEARTVAQLQAITPPGPALGYCSNEAGGECAVYFAPVAGVWRRVDTNATISA